MGPRKESNRSQIPNAPELHIQQFIDHFSQNSKSKIDCQTKQKKYLRNIGRCLIQRAFKAKLQKEGSEGRGGEGKGRRENGQGGESSSKRALSPTAFPDLILFGLGPKEDPGLASVF